eukprot:9497093-Pyramimonas_sp.AAC.1
MGVVTDGAEGGSGRGGGGRSGGGNVRARFYRLSPIRAPSICMQLKQLAPTWPPPSTRCPAPGRPAGASSARRRASTSWRPWRGLAAGAGA